jgi:hypothetical protein
VPQQALPFFRAAMDYLLLTQELTP